VCIRPASLETPLNEEVAKQIEIGLTEAGIGSTDQLSEDASEDPATSHAHNLAYYRLRDTGWLTEGTEKWRVYVDMNPDAFMVLGAITDFGNSRVRVAGGGRRQEQPGRRVQGTGDHGPGSRQRP
jgi:hypothetical protein